MTNAPPTTPMFSKMYEAPREPLPEGTLRNLPRATQQFMTEDTYVGQQALGISSQVMDFFPRMLRGARANVKGALEATLGKDVTRAIRKYAKYTPGARNGPGRSAWSRRRISPAEIFGGGSSHRQASTIASASPYRCPPAVSTICPLSE